MTHKKYNKIFALGKEECEGILDDGVILVQEKIDGANTSIWMHEGKLHYGSRTQMLDAGFNGFVEYVNSHTGIKALLDAFPHFRLYGEWLVRHTIAYNETAYKNFYLYDILDEISGEYIDPVIVADIADKWGIKRPQIFYYGKVIPLEEIKKYVGETDLGTRGEGVVIKRHDYTSKFNVKPQYAKIVTEEFREDNAVVFGGNSKQSETYSEVYICNKYMTLSRLNKIINKIETAEDRKLTLADTPRIANTVYHDMLTEEIWDISKNVSSIDFKALARVCHKKAIQMFKEVITGDVSVAHNEVTA